ncbi:MAG: conserved phage C-terminal domain-containing protein [Smithella sp.]|jgi:uncharacterized phage protein (TIGR02220 family)
MSKSPAFQLYAADFYMDTADWEPEEIGVYFRLLMYQWINKTIPNDTRRMARIAGLSPKKFTKNFKIISPKFSKKDDKFLINLKMEEIRHEQDNYRKSQSESGKKGAEKRWRERSDPIGDPIGEANSENIALQSSSSYIDTSVSIVEQAKNNGSDYSPENVKRIISYLNKKTGKNFKPNTRETVNHIKARFNEKFKLEDFKTVIDNQTAKWKSDPKMIDYLRPETLFGTKFESYLQSIPPETEKLKKPLTQEDVENGTLEKNPTAIG